MEGKIEILFENEEFLAVNKPAPLLVHPTRPSDEGTLLGFLQAQRPHPFYALINRLDRETSGIVLVAKSSEVASLLGKQMMRREVEKIYLGIVHGEVSWDHRRIEKPIGRLGVNESNLIYAKQGILSEGVPAITECTVLQRSTQVSLLRMKLETGKLHQIRVHLESEGYPIVGDKLYGVDPQVYLEMCEGKGFERHMAHLKIQRHALHAAEMRLEWKGEQIQVIAPFPQDLSDCFERLSCSKISGSLTSTHSFSMK